jgi:hypothetical protein
MTEEEKSKVPLHKERMGLLDKDTQYKLLEAKRKALSSDMAVCFNTAEGRRVLKYILNICGYRKGKVGGNPQLGMDVFQGTMYNAAREQVAIELIEHIPVYIMKDCEYGVFKDLES